MDVCIPPKYFLITQSSVEWLCYNVDSALYIHIPKSVCMSVNTVNTCSRSMYGEERERLFNRQNGNKMRLGTKQ